MAKKENMNSEKKTTSGKTAAMKSASKNSDDGRSKIQSKSTEKTAPSQVDHGHIVHVEYTGTLDNGDVFDTSKNHGPLKFVAGGGQVIKGFDDAVHGMKLNDKKTVKIPKHEAYGDVNPAMMHTVPLDKIPPEIRSQLKVGGFIVMQSPQGHQMPARVSNLDKTSVTLDLNHPLAGKNLTFEIKVVGIEESDGTESGDDCCGGDCECSHGDKSDKSGKSGASGKSKKSGKDSDDCCGGGCGCKH